MNIYKASENYEVQRRLLEEPTQVELVLTFSFIGDLSEFAGENMATSADWLAALGSQLAAASDGTVIFRDTVNLLDELEREPSLSRAEAIQEGALTWQRHLASVARAVLSAQLSAVAAGAAQAMSWVASYVSATDKLRDARRG